MQQENGLLKINLAAPLKNFQGVIFTHPTGNIDLAFCAVTALLSMDGEALSGDEKYLRYKLAKRVRGESAELTLEEAEKINSLIGKHFSTLIAGAAREELENQIAVLQGLKENT